jgi:hypothetical protein
LTGPTGPSGISAAFAFSDPGPIELPVAPTSLTIGVLNGLVAGKYVISGKAQIDFFRDLSPSTATCTLSVTDINGTIELDASAATFSNPTTATLPFAATADLPLGGDLTLDCVGDRMTASRIKLTAIQVDALTVLP